MDQAAERHGPGLGEREAESPEKQETPTAIWKNDQADDQSTISVSLTQYHLKVLIGMIKTTGMEGHLPDLTERLQKSLQALTSLAEELKS